MSQENESFQTPTAFIPLLLLSISLLIVFVWQLNNTSQQRTMLQNAIAQQAQQVQQSQQIQSALEKIASDLLELSKTDEVAKAIVTKHGISRAGGSPQAAQPAAKQ